jgi:hypothetical protein
MRQEYLQGQKPYQGRKTRPSQRHWKTKMYPESLKIYSPLKKSQPSYKQMIVNNVGMLCCGLSSLRMIFQQATG